MENIHFISILLAVITLTRRYHAWRIRRTSMLIIEDLKAKGALDAKSAVELPYARVRLVKMGVRDHQPIALKHLLFDNIVCIAEDGRYYIPEAVQRSLAQKASTNTEAQMTPIANICQAVRIWLRNNTARMAAITGLRKKR